MIFKSSERRQCPKTSCINNPLIPFISSNNLHLVKCYQTITFIWQQYIRFRLPHVNQRNFKVYPHCKGNSPHSASRGCLSSTQILHACMHTCMHTNTACTHAWNPSFVYLGVPLSGHQLGATQHTVCRSSQTVI